MQIAQIKYRLKLFDPMPRLLLKRFSSIFVKLVTTTASPSKAMLLDKNGMQFSQATYIE